MLYSFNVATIQQEGKEYWIVLKSATTTTKPPNIQAAAPEDNGRTYFLYF